MKHEPASGGNAIRPAAFRDTVIRMPAQRPKIFWLSLQGVLGLSLIIYGQALGALIVEDCRSFFPPFVFPRCAQPLVAIGIGAVICVSALAQVVQRLARRWRKPD